MTVETEFALDVDLGEIIPRHHVVLTSFDFAGLCNRVHLTSTVPKG